MRISTPRPLATDEVLDFDLQLSGADHVDGRARVLRHEGHGAYAMRFEELLEPARERLRALAGRRRCTDGDRAPRVTYGCRYL